MSRLYQGGGKYQEISRIYLGGGNYQEISRLYHGGGKCQENIIRSFNSTVYII